MQHSLQRALGDLTESLLSVEYQQSKFRFNKDICSLMSLYYGNSYYVSFGSSQEPNNPSSLSGSEPIGTDNTQCFMGDKNIKLFYW